MSRSCCCCSDLLLFLFSSGGILVALQFGLLPHRVAMETRQMSNSIGEGAAKVLASNSIGLSLWTPWSARVTGPTVFGGGAGGVYRIPSLLWVPPLEEGADGHLLAFAERRESKQDFGLISICMRRSTTAGRSWSRETKLFAPAAFGLAGETLTVGNPTSVFDAQTRKVLLLFIVQYGEDTEETITNGTSRGSRWVFISESSNAGESWSRPRNITEAVKRPEWTWYATGPGNAIQLAEVGPFQGRLVVPCDHILAQGNGPMKYHSHLIISDDNGATWRIGGVSRVPTNECAVAELAGGTLLVNSRDWSGIHQRTLSWSVDGGTTFHATEGSKLREPGKRGEIGQGCEASMISHQISKDRRLLLFSNPDSRRKFNLTLKVSVDGKLWSHVRRLYTGPSAYSSLVVLPPQGAGSGGEAAVGEILSAEPRVACLFECGEEKYWERIDFLLLPLREVVAAGPHQR